LYWFISTDIFTSDNDFVESRSQRPRVENVPDEADPEQTIWMLQEILRMIKEDKEKQARRPIK